MFLAPILLLQAASADCTAIVPPPPALAAWRVPRNRPAVGVRFDLAGARAVAGLTAEERARGGKAMILEITVEHAGRYAVALSDAAWIDLARDGIALKPLSFGHGPACTGIRKIVRFELPAGRYKLRLSGIVAPMIGVLVAPE